jgi:hypothetical protein
MDSDYFLDHQQRFLFTGPTGSRILFTIEANWYMFARIGQNVRPLVIFIRKHGLVNYASMMLFLQVFQLAR